MGGQSTGTWKVENGIGVMNGVVADVPSLKAPGFIKAAADGSFPDASTAAGGSLELLVRSKTPEYKGFRVTVAAGALSPSFACAGGGNLPLSRGCYKAKFSVPGGDGWQRVVLPLSSFSDLWSSATGEHTKECSEDASACLTAEQLGNIQRVELWAEGADGTVNLECKAVTAVAPAASPAARAALW